MKLRYVLLITFFLSTLVGFTLSTLYDRQVAGYERNNAEYSIGDNHDTSDNR